MLLSIFDDFNVKPKDVIVIGDSVRDLETAVQAGALPVLVTTGKGLKTKAMLPRHPDLQKTTVFNNLLDSVNHLLTSR
jgi:histidinol phosphatase-like enzyme